MARLLLYKHEINNMRDHRIPKLALHSSQNHLRFKQGWYKDTRAWLNHWEIDENVALQNINNIKNIVTSKFKEKMWREKDLEAKIKLRYYKEIINPTLEDQKYLSVLTSSKKKINIAKIRTNSHELHSEICRWEVLKTPWVERICHLCENINLCCMGTRTEGSGTHTGYLGTAMVRTQMYPHVPQALITYRVLRKKI